MSVPTLGYSIEFLSRGGSAEHGEWEADWLGKENGLVGPALLLRLVWPSPLAMTVADVELTNGRTWGILIPSKFLSDPLYR